MSDQQPNLDALLARWPYAPGQVSARRSHGADGRPVVQLRIDLGVLQMEVSGRPDGSRPEGFPTLLEALRAEVSDGGECDLDEDRCVEVDREFLQFYHRRVAWLALRRFEEAVADADHTLALMDVTGDHADDSDWVDLHEQYRPFVLFHRTQAAALAALQASDAEAAVLEIDGGLAKLQEVADDWSDDQGLELPAGEEPRNDLEDFVDKLGELRASILSEYDLGASLADQLAEAVAHEQYELAAELRDRIAVRLSNRDAS